MTALRASADANGGAPNFSRVASETELPRTSLKRWWSEDAGAAPVGTLHHLPPPQAPQPPPVGASDETMAILRMSPAAHAAFMYQELDVDIVSARVRCPTILPGLRRIQMEAADRYRIEAAKERDKRTMTPKEAIEHAEKVAAGMGANAAQVMLEVFKRRGLVG